MTNASCVAVYSPFAIMVVLFLINLLMRDRTQFVLRHYFYFNLALMCWLILEMVYFMVDDSWWIAYLLNLKLPFISAVSFTLFMLLSGFYRIYKRIPKAVIYALFAVPLITLLISATSMSHPLLRSELQVLVVEPLHRIHVVNGPWYYIHAAYSYGLTIASGVIILVRHRRLPDAYKSTSITLIAGILIYALGTIIEIFRLEATPLDSTLLGVAIGNVFLYVSIMSNRRADFQNITKREIMNYMDDIIILLDHQRRIADINTVGKNWLDAMEMPLEFINYEAFFDQLEHSHKVIKKEDDERLGQNLYLVNTEHPLIYQMSHQLMHDDDNNLVGEYLLLTDITRNYLFIERLEEAVGLDQLTGLPNRHSYQEMKRELDKRDNLPLSVIMGDVNGLKHVNDVYGHQQGDLMLQVIADVIKSNCPDDGMVARIGGDEFFMIVPQCSQQRAMEIIHHIAEDLDAVEGYVFQPSIALGSATKMLPEENINLLINEADTRMYQNK